MLRKLTRRGAIYTSRTHVPQDLQDLLGRKEVTRSLRTTDRATAGRRLCLWRAHLDTFLTLARRQGRFMSREQLDELTRQYLDRTFDEIEQGLSLAWGQPGLDAHRFRLIERAEELSAALSHADPSATLAEAEALLPDADSGAQRVLARRLVEVKLQATEAELRALAGEPLARPRFAPTSAPQAPPKPTPRLPEVAARYVEERVAEGKWSAKTTKQHETMLNVIGDLLGARPVGSITKDDVRELGLALARLPTNFTKRYPGLAPSEVIEAAGEDPTVERLAPRSQNKYRQLARSLFSWAHEHDLTPHNPATILSNVKEGRAKDDRLPFTDADLVTFFERLDKDPDRPELFWLPRILAYSGMRLGEAAQLRSADLQEHQGVWVWRVHEDDEGRELKTRASNRMVPVHPRLLELGVKAFAEGRGGPLFDEKWRTPKAPGRGAVDALSKLLARRLRSAGIKEPRKTGAHSFRHTVSARLKDASVPEYQIAEILGHEHDSMSTGRYGATTNVEALGQVLAKLELPI